MAHRCRGSTWIFRIGNATGLGGADHLADLPERVPNSVPTPHPDRAVRSSTQGGACPASHPRPRRGGGRLPPGGGRPPADAHVVKIERVIPAVVAGARSTRE